MTAGSGAPNQPEIPDLDEHEEAVVERSRTSLKKERVNNEKALAALVRELLALNEEKWRDLGVPDEGIDALADAQKIKSHGARGRQLRLVRARLRDADWAVIRRGLDRIRAGLSVGTPAAPSRAIEWTEQLLVQGDAGLARFLEECSSADRKRLRQLVRNVKMAPEKKTRQSASTTRAGHHSGARRGQR